MMPRSVRLLPRAVPAVVALVVPFACTHDDPPPTSAATPTTAASSSALASTTFVADLPSSSAAPTTVPAPPVDAWALSFTGGIEGRAEGEPVRLGYVSDADDSTGATAGALAAVELVNRELGGIHGRPLELVTCTVASRADAEHCGQQLADDPGVLSVLTGSLVVGNRALYDRVAPAKAVLVGHPLTMDDVTDARVRVWSVGAIGVVRGLAVYAVGQDPRPSSVTVVHPSGTSGMAALDLLVRPALDAAGVAINAVAVEPGADEVAVAALLGAVGATDIVIALLDAAGCAELDGAFDRLDVHPRVLVAESCVGAAMDSHLDGEGRAGPLPDGWYLGTGGANRFAPDVTSGAASFTSAMTATSGRAGPASAPVFADLLAMVRLLNEQDPARLDIATMRSAVDAYPGPVPMQSGQLQCGAQPFPAVCGHEVAVHRYQAGSWTVVAGGPDASPIEVALG